MVELIDTISELPPSRRAELLTGRGRGGFVGRGGEGALPEGCHTRPTG